MRTWNSGAEKKKKGKGYSVGGQKSWKELLFVEGKTPVRIDEPAIAYWDFLSITLLLWTAIVAPFEVAFGVPNSTSDPIFAVDRIVDCCFFFDLILNFFRPSSPLAAAKKMKTIRDDYLSGWFGLGPYASLVGHQPSLAPSSLLAPVLSQDDICHTYT